VSGEPLDPPVTTRAAALVATRGDDRPDGDHAVDVETYYTDAGMDYRAWSPRFNMHFGYWRRGLGPLALEPQLDEMSRQVFQRLALADGQRVLDLGCGVGTPARLLASEHAVAVTAVTKVEWQIAMARRLSADLAPRGSVEWVQGDFTALALPAASHDAAFSIEASCHAPGGSKEALVREVARVLRPGGRFVVADGFLKRSDRMPRWYARIMRIMVHGWAVEQFADLGLFTAALARHGLRVEAVEDVSWRIAPSVLHVPRVTLQFLFKELILERQPLNATRRGHIKACVLSPLIGLGRRWFGYHLVTARRRDDTEAT
jgi:ubiquinone/menaquinone biosynthesis C-methylase UbiE